MIPLRFQPPTLQARGRLTSPPTFLLILGIEQNPQLVLYYLEGAVSYLSYLLKRW